MKPSVWPILKRRVKDPELREKLRPNYRAACKRLILSPNFYECIQHPNAELVVSGIEAVEPKGVRTRDGKLHELDVLVLATGFRADRFIRPTWCVAGAVLISTTYGRIIRLPIFRFRFQSFRTSLC